jgi:TetR/AcrR family transcriptional regulator, repressor for uid operon
MCAKVTLQHKLEIQDRIIAAALVSFSKKGYDKTRMDDIALESKVSKGTIYIYFKSKEDLFYALCEKNLVELRKQLFSLFVTNNKNDELNNQKLISDTKEYYNNFSHFENSYIIFLEILSKSTRDEKLKSAMYSQHKKVTEVMKEHILSYLKADGKATIPDDGEIDCIVMSLIAVYNGLMINRLLGVEEEANKKTWIDIVSRILGTTMTTLTTP